MIRNAAATLLFSLCALPCFGQESASITTHADPLEISLGDRVTVVVEVEHGVRQIVSWPAFSDTLGSFELLEFNEIAPVANGARVTTAGRFVLTTFELGEMEIPPITVTVADSAESERQLLSSEPMTITVQSVGIDEGGDIRSVKAPLEIPRNWLLLLPWVLLVAGLVVFSYWAYRRYRSRDMTPDSRLGSKLPPRPPHEVAYEALERLEAKRLLESGEIKQYFIEVSEIVRTYLEARYRIDAMEMTSRELLHALKLLGLEAEVFDLFPPFFNRADLVKFAKSRPGLEASKEMIPMARLLIDETRPADRQQNQTASVDVVGGVEQEQRVEAAQR